MAEKLFNMGKPQSLIYVGRTKCCGKVVAACCDADLVGKRELREALADMVLGDLVITREPTATIGGRCTCSKSGSPVSEPR